MGELLTSLDVVNKQFKKSFVSGYDHNEVDEFLDRVAETLQAYVQKNKDMERTLEEQGERLSEYDSIKNSLHEALLMAQRTAEEKVANASRVADEKIAEARAKADDILAEARMNADRIRREAEDGVAKMADEIDRLRELKDHSFSMLRRFVSEMQDTIARGEAGGAIELPDSIRAIVSARSAHAKREQEEPPILVEHHHAEFLGDLGADQATKIPPNKIEISDTLSALGIDPSLLNTDV